MRDKSMGTDIFIDVNLKREGAKKSKHLTTCIVAVDYDAAITFIDKTTTKNEQIYVVAALRDFADAMEAELNRPENTRDHIVDGSTH